LLALLLAASNAFAFGLLNQMWTPAADTGGGEEELTCGTSGLIFYWPAESTDVTSGTPAGCSSIGDTTASSESGVSISSTDKSDGSNSVSFPTNYDRYTFTISQNFNEDEGTIWCDVRITDVVTGGNFLKAEYASGDRVRLFTYGSSGAAGFYGEYKGNGNTQTCYPGASYDETGTYKWVRIKYQWKVGTGHKIETWLLDNSSPREVLSTLDSSSVEDTLVQMNGTPTDLEMGALASDGVTGYIDNIRIYNTSDL